MREFAAPLAASWPGDRSPGRAVGASYAPTAQFFGELRQYLGLSLDQAAAHVHTHPYVIAALESGALSDLPSWAETSRIVASYAALAQIDPTPALHALKLQCEPKPQVMAPTHAPTARAGRPPSDSGQNPPSTTARSPARFMPSLWPVGRIATFAALFALLGLATQTTALQATMMTKLPRPIASAMRQAQDAVLIRVSRKFEGMTWIDVDDPRSRRSDKLPKNPR